MELGNGEGVAPFVLTTGDDVFDDRMRLFGSVRPVCFSAASLLHPSSLQHHWRYVLLLWNIVFASCFFFAGLQHVGREYLRQLPGVHRLPTRDELVLSDRLGLRLSTRA